MNLDDRGINLHNLNVKNPRLHIHYNEYSTSFKYLVKICQRAGARFLKMDVNHEQKNEQLQFILYCIDIPPLKATDNAEKGLQLCQDKEKY